MTAVELSYEEMVYKVHLLDAGDRLFARTVDKDNGCVEWTGCLNSRGYGVISVAGKRMLTHRVSYELHNDLIPDGLTIDHLCRNKRCVHPDHLEAVTGAENTRRAFAEKTHCPRGHELAGANLITKQRPNGKTIRNCRECNNAQQRARAFVRNYLDRTATRAEIAAMVDAEFAPEADC